MADSAKVRLVRCPKCENLLSELADYSVYQCGGCGAVLRAKAKRQESEKSDEEMPGLASSRLENSLEKKSAAETIDASDSDVKLISRSFRGDDIRTQPKVDQECVVENGSHRRDKLGRELGDPNPDIGSRTDSRRSGRMSNWKMEDSARLESVRIPASNHRADEGPSKPNHQAGSSSNGFGGGGSRARYLEQDRAELLMKLDELRDQLSRSCEVSDRPFKHVVGSPNLSRFAEPIPYNNHNNNNSSGYEMPGRGFYPSVPYPSHSHGYGDLFGPQIHKGGSHHFPRPYPQQQQQPSHPYFPGQYMENNPDPFEPYSHHGGAGFHHQPSCACFHCYEKHRRASAPVAPPPPPPPPHHTRWPSDFNHHHHHDVGPAARARGRRVVVYAGARRRRPVGGGAPFLACTNCFEVLKLPKRMKLEESAQSKLKCGACSAVMNLDVVDKRIVLSVNSEVTHDSTLYSHGHGNRSYAFSSDDYDNSGYDFQAMDREPVPPLVGKPRETESLHSSSPCTSEDENSSEIPTAKREISSSGQQPTKTDLSPPPAGSPLQEHFDFSTKNRVTNRVGKGNQSNRSDQEKVKPNKITSRQNSLNKASLATEMEVSFNEYSNAGLSQDSGDASRAEDPIRTNKGGESFFSNIIKKSFKDFSRSNQGEEHSKSNVSVNGHPITDRVLKKARKLAGTIYPGQYWYDYRAGFWGIMGGPCLGIVLPYIEEFNYPMPENCAGGTTGVYVNGRELHQKDLDLLSSRGLPTSRDRSYIIEISGRVLDEDTGEELDCLGKLAPTVVKAKHGFGMKAPKVVRPNPNS